MRADAEQAERHQEVREAARGWARAGTIDTHTQGAIDALYPDDRARLGPVFRSLVFGFTVVIAWSLFGLAGLLLFDRFGRAGGLLFLCFGALLAAATELALGPLKRRQGGIESATGMLAVTFLSCGLVWLTHEILGLHFDATLNVALAVIMLLCAAACHRWGYTAYAVVAGAALFLLLARTPLGRLAWVIVPLLLTPALLHAAAAARLAPVHRRSCQALAAVALLFLYLALHLGSWDAGMVELLTGHWQAAPRDTAARPLFVTATALLPLLLLGWGIRTRRRLLINLGLLALLASLVTLRAYVHVAPAWVALLAGGGGAILLALGLRRWLDSGPHHERGGFTASPLFTDPERRGVLEVAAGVVNLSPHARPAAAPGYQGAGGRSGGAGATGEF